MYVIFFFEYKKLIDKQSIKFTIFTFYNIKQVVYLQYRQQNLIFYYISLSNLIGKQCFKLKVHFTIHIIKIINFFQFKNINKQLLIYLYVDFTANNSNHRFYFFSY
ncbi:hypothetical protein EDEG_03057 [Edhazardia aedis USNM 41457]|uniref:Uncharacterized protein n=1 Tax=Edhazardia aedis (strain USNM 41457) TaxID=1003232 RepID=J9DIX9_EDHAE|nr:hypothetical protein EDEG_03057 [Edhazardia aedis USNM 41457]|eukprot:EJW02545.1 hypothetical protein EDEG_03057 [Edhazardia aedis USNM 41457]